MPDILLPDTVNAKSVLDVVHLQLGAHTIKMFYQTSFEVTNGVRMAAKLAMRHEGVQIPDWREVLASVQTQMPFRERTHHGYRRSNELSNITKWDIKWNGSLVVLVFDELTCKLHYSDALRLHTILRRASQNAKAWAGDESKTMRMTAYLNDAEENYKHGYAT